MDQMRGSTQVVPDLFILLAGLQCRRGSEITVLSDQSVYLFVFSEFDQRRGQNNQITSIGQSHPGTINRFISEPGTFKLCRIEIDHYFFQWFFEHFKVDQQRKLSSQVEYFRIVTDK